MTAHANQILSDVMHLSPVEKAELVEKILESFNFPDRSEIDNEWAKEVEERIDAYEKGKIGATPAKKVFKEIQKRQRK